MNSAWSRYHSSSLLLFLLSSLFLVLLSSFHAQIPEFCRSVRSWYRTWLPLPFCWTHYALPALHSTHETYPTKFLRYLSDSIAFPYFLKLRISHSSHLFPIFYAWVYRYQRPQVSFPISFFDAVSCKSLIILSASLFLPLHSFQDLAFSTSLILDSAFFTSPLLFNALLIRLARFLPNTYFPSLLAGNPS